MASGLLIPALQGFSVTSAAFLSGYQLCISTTALPPFNLAPAPLLAKQWASMFSIGAILGPGTSLISALSSFSLAYITSEPKYAVAGASTIFILPFTVLVLGNTNKLLHAKEKKLKNTEDVAVSAADDKEVRELVKFWGQANIARGLFPLLGAAVGLWTMMG